MPLSHHLPSTGISVHGAFRQGSCSRKMKLGPNHLSLCAEVEKLHLYLELLPVGGARSTHSTVHCTCGAPKPRCACLGRSSFAEIHQPILWLHCRRLLSPLQKERLCVDKTSAKVTCHKDAKIRVQARDRYYSSSWSNWASVSCS